MLVWEVGTFWETAPMRTGVDLFGKEDAGALRGLGKRNLCLGT